MDRHVIIAGGGIGLRMNSNTPKQFLPLGNKPLIFHTIHKFVSAVPGILVIVVLREDQFDHWKTARKEFAYSYPCRLVAGGETRYESIKNGLKQIAGDNGVVAIHDAVRPLVSETLIRQLFKVAGEKGNAVPVVALKDSIREVRGDDSKYVDRRKYRMVQTPQCFNTSLIKRAYTQPFSPEITDDAMLVEQLGEHINLVDGEETNIKITTQADLRIAESLLDKGMVKPVV